MTLQWNFRTKNDLQFDDRLKMKKPSIIPIFCLVVIFVIGAALAVHAVKHAYPQTAVAYHSWWHELQRLDLK